MFKNMSLSQIESSTQLSGWIKFPLQLCRNWDLNFSAEKQYKGCITNYTYSYTLKENEYKKRKKAVHPSYHYRNRNRQRVKCLLEILVHASNLWQISDMIMEETHWILVILVPFLSDTIMKQKATEYLLLTTWHIITSHNYKSGYQILEDDSHKSYCHELRSRFQCAPKDTLHPIIHVTAKYL